MATNKLKAITTAAKKLYKTGRYKKWTDAIKAASKQISGTKTHKDTKSHNVNIRVVSGVKKKAAKNKVGAVKIIQKGQSKNAKVTKVLQQVRSKSGTFKGYKTVSGIGNVYKVRDMLENDLSSIIKQIENAKSNKIKTTDIFYKRLKANEKLLRKQLKDQNKLINQLLK